MGDETRLSLAAGPEQGFLARILDGVERAGNRMPNPAILFLALCGIVIVLSQVLYWFGVGATYEVVPTPPVAAEEIYYGGSNVPVYAGPTTPIPARDYGKVVTETTRVQGLLTGSGVRYLFTSFVGNFRNFAALAIILVVMIGVGLAEAAGLIAALIQKLVGVSRKERLTFIVVLLGMVSSIASDAGYLVLVPLGAAAFKSVGRHPLAGIAAAFAGVAAGFGVNFLITPLDVVLTEITNEAAGTAAKHIDIAANLYFGIASTIFATFVVTIVTARLVENRLGSWDSAEEEEGQQTAGGAPEVSAEDSARGLRYALWATLAVLAALALLTVIPGAPLRNPETGKIVGESPFMDSLIVIITIIFFAAGLAYGRGARTLRGTDEIIGAITKTWATLTKLLLLFLLIAQFIAYFNFSNVAQVLAAKLGDVLEHLDIGSVWLLIGVIVMAMIANFILPQAIGKWALFAPIFVPLFIRLGIAPQTVLAAFRVGDSPTNVISPLMAYFRSSSSSRSATGRTPASAPSSR